MNNKITSLKEKFRVALTSTAKVISEDFDRPKKSFLIVFWSLKIKFPFGSKTLRSYFLPLISFNGRYTPKISFSSVLKVVLFNPIYSSIPIPPSPLKSLR